MTTVKFFCPECGKAVEVGDNLAGTSAFCPHCATRITIPQPDGGQSNPVVPQQGDVSQPKLQLRSNKPVPNKPCPKCQAECVADAVICVSCGTDLRTGRQVSSATTRQEHFVSFRKLGRVALPIGGVVLLLGGLIWAHKAYQSHKQVQELAQRTAEIETNYSTLTSKVSRSTADISNVCSDMKTLAQKAASFNLPDWKVRCDEYAAIMESRKIALDGELLSLSNDVASLALKGEYRTAAKLLRAYKGEFTVETENFRNKLAAEYEGKASQQMAQVRKAEDERSSAADAVRAEKVTAEIKLSVHNFRETQYARLQIQAARDFHLLQGKAVTLKLVGGGVISGVVQALGSNTAVIAINNGEATFIKEQLAAVSRQLLFKDDYIEGVVTTQKANDQRADANAMIAAVNTAMTTRDYRKKIIILSTALSDFPDAPNAAAVELILSQCNKWEENSAKGLVLFKWQWMTPQEAEEIQARARLIASNSQKATNRPANFVWTPYNFKGAYHNSSSGQAGNSEGGSPVSPQEYRAIMDAAGFSGGSSSAGAYGPMVNGIDGLDPAYRKKTYGY